MSDLIILFLICFLVGGLILWATFTGSSSSPAFTGLLGVYFILLPIFLALGWTTVYALMVTIPLGFLWTAIAIHGITSPFRFCIKHEATYLQPVFDHSRNGRHKYYALGCQIKSGRHTRQLKSCDWYDLSFIEKRYVPNSTVAVWVNKKNDNEFRVRRYFSVGSMFLLLFLGITFLGFALKLIFDFIGEFT